MNILEEANKLTSGVKREAYGSPLLCYRRIARLWTLIIGHEIELHQVALCMLAFKIARELNAHQRDNLVDIAGYARTIEMMEEELELEQTNRRIKNESE
jgi:hypothetical protein